MAKHIIWDIQIKATRGEEILGTARRKSIVFAGDSVVREERRMRDTTAKMMREIKGKLIMEGKM